MSSGDHSRRRRRSHLGSARRWQTAPTAARATPAAASVAGPAALIGTSAYPLSVDLGALLVSSAITVAIGAYLFERVEAV